MKTEFLREFVTLAHCGSFSSASEKLFISQPTLSNHIRAIEREVGFDLIDRSHENELTTAGSLFLSVAQSVLNRLDSALDECRRYDDV